MAAMENDKKKVVAVVGAGLVGSLEACLLAQRGMEVGSVGRRTQWAHGAFHTSRAGNGWRWWWRQDWWAL